MVKSSQGLFILWRKIAPKARFFLQLHIFGSISSLILRLERLHWANKWLFTEVAKFNRNMLVKL